MKNIFSITVFLCVSLMFGGCAPTQAGSAAQTPALDKRALAQDLIEMDWNLFTGFQRFVFSDRISGEFLPDKYTFLDEAETAFHAATPIDLSFSVNKALVKDDKLAVSITWQRRTMDRSTGDLILKKGRGTIVYQNKGGQWLIYKIQGNSIFTF